MAAEPRLGGASVVYGFKASEDDRSELGRVIVRELGRVMVMSDIVGEREGK